MYNEIVESDQLAKAHFFIAIGWNRSKRMSLIAKEEIVAKIEEIAERIDAHFSLSTAERAAMSSACWETARKMTVEKNARETCQLFEEVLREKFRV